MELEDLQEMLELGRKARQDGLSNEEARNQTRPLIESKTQPIANAKVKKAAYVELWQKFWEGFNQP